MIDISVLIIPLVLFIITVGFGFWVRNAGRPYHSGLFNVHKLVALAGVVSGVLKLRGEFMLLELSTSLSVALGAAGFSVVLLFATGAVMSIREEDPGLALLFHRAGPVIIVLCLVIVFAVL